MSLKKHIEKFDELHPEYVENTDYTDKLFAPVEELENRIHDRDGIIEYLEEEFAWTILIREASICNWNSFLGSGMFRE